MLKTYSTFSGISITCSRENIKFFAIELIEMIEMRTFSLYFCLPAPSPLAPCSLPLCSQLPAPVLAVRPLRKLYLHEMRSIT